MTREVKKPVATKSGGVAPLKALHRIVYGKGATVDGGAFFVPTTADERDEMVKMGIAAELDDVEALVAKSLFAEAAATTGDIEDALG